MPPKTLSMAEAVEYLKTLGIVTNRQTVYNWSKVGRKGVKLKTMACKGGPLGQMKNVTTDKWVAAFVSDLGLAGVQTTPA